VPIEYFTAPLPTESSYGELTRAFEKDIKAFRHLYSALELLLSSHHALHNNTVVAGLQADQSLLWLSFIIVHSHYSAQSFCSSG